MKIGDTKEPLTEMTVKIKYEELLALNNFLASIEVLPPDVELAFDKLVDAFTGVNDY